MKELVIKVNLTDDDTNADVSSLLIEIMEVCGDNFYSIESANVDGEEMFYVGEGFRGEFRRKDGGVVGGTDNGNGRRYCNL